MKRKARFQNPSWKDQSGFSLVSALVAMSILGLITVGFAKIMKNAMSAQQNIALKDDAGMVKRMIVGATSCQASMPTGTCPPGTLVPLMRVHPSGSTSQIVGNLGAGIKYGKWTPRALCNATGDGIYLQMARLTSTGTLASTSASDFLPDPLTGAQTTWASPQSYVLGTNTEICTSGQASSTIFCDKTFFAAAGEIINGSYGSEYSYFAANDCGGRLPDSTYTGVATKIWRCNGSSDFQIANPPNAYGGTGPGVAVQQLNAACGWTSIGVLYIKTK